MVAACRLAPPLRAACLGASASCSATRFSSAVRQVLSASSASAKLTALNTDAATRRRMSGSSPSRRAMYPASSSNCSTESTGCPTRPGGGASAPRSSLPPASRTTMVPATRSPSRCARLLTRMQTAPARPVGKGCRSTILIRLRSTEPWKVSGSPPAWMTRSPIARLPGVLPPLSPSKSMKYPHCAKKVAKMRIVTLNDSMMSPSAPA